MDIQTNSTDGLAYVIFSPSFPLLAVMYADWQARVFSPFESKSNLIYRKKLAPSFFFRDDRTNVASIQLLIRPVGNYPLLFRCSLAMGFYSQQTWLSCRDIRMGDFNITMLTDWLIDWPTEWTELMFLLFSCSFCPFIMRICANVLYFIRLSLPPRFILSAHYESMSVWITYLHGLYTPKTSPTHPTLPELSHQTYKK